MAARRGERRREERSRREGVGTGGRESGHVDVERRGGRWSREGQRADIVTKTLDRADAEAWTETKAERTATSYSRGAYGWPNLQPHVHADGLPSSCELMTSGGGAADRGAGQVAAEERL